VKREIEEAIMTAPSECEYQKICPTTNFWVEEKKKFIETVCKASECAFCVMRGNFEAQGIGKNAEEWNRLVNFYAERKKQFPPHGVIKVGVKEK
jgi:hypothetical protein